MKWINKGRVFVSDNGRWRVARVWRTWVLYDRDRVIGATFLTSFEAMNKGENEVRIEQRRPEAV